MPDAEVPLRGLAFGRRKTMELIRRAADGKDTPKEEAEAAVELLSGPPKTEARELVEFLRGGAFAIHPEASRSSRP